jgi:GDP-4-dehydro-6-deoxy-D-mannose reductase
MLKILVTGTNGFVGKHLTRELVGGNIAVTGIGREKEADSEISNLLANWVQCDLSDYQEVDKLDLSEYSAIVSLAGLANVGQSFNEAELYQKVNVDVLATLCEKLQMQKLNPRIIAVSTGAVYSSQQKMPLTESSDLIKQGSPYALSKIAMEKAVLKFRKDGLTNCVIVRPFNHIGPGQNPGFLVPDLYEQIQESLKSDKILRTGNLATRRDYTDVRDVVRAYAKLATADKLSYDTYNVCSGRSIAGEKVLSELMANIDSNNRLRVETDPTRIRPNDPMDLYGDNSRLKQDTGWQPQIPFEETIADFIKWKRSLNS